MDNEKVIAEAVDILAWAETGLGKGEDWDKGFARGVKHLAGMLILYANTDWDTLIAEAKKKAEAATHV